MSVRASATLHFSRGVQLKAILRTRAGACLCASRRNPPRGPGRVRCILIASERDDVACAHSHACTYRVELSPVFV